MKYKQYAVKARKRLRLGALLVSNKKQISNSFEIKFQPYLSMRIYNNVFQFYFKGRGMKKQILLVPLAIGAIGGANAAENNATKS